MTPDAAPRNAIACAVTGAAGLASELARWSAYTLAAILLLGAGTMWCRRAASALQQPLEWPGLLLVGAVSAGAGVVARVLARRPMSSRVDQATGGRQGSLASPAGAGTGGQAASGARAPGTFEWVVSLGLAAWGIALSPSGTSAGLLVFWGIVAGEEVWAWRSALGLACLPVWLRRGRGPEGTSESPVAAPSRKLVSGLRLPPPGDVTQEFVRSRQPDGGERLAGWMRVPLSPGQRTATVHLAFCPPFARTPQITVAQQEGPTARIKEAQLLPYGARLDLKLTHAADAPATVLLEIVVRADACTIDAEEG